ncbi:MAG: GMC family oxidoreductase, partial [Cyclobacteriaceae bacterium]|nr:GMC family oxidoreductase [Cyclobacteriaceae bacterium]
EGNGPKRAGCIFCGGCMTGCRHNAKNTLDKNYLYLAQKLGVEILAEQEVVNVIPLNTENTSDGYRVELKSSTSFFKSKTAFTSKGVIFSGGVLGTVKLLLKLKRKGSLPLLSPKVGQDVRTNNETLVSVSSMDKNIDVSKGLAIGSILHTDDNTHLEVCRYSEGSDFWKLLHLPHSKGTSFFPRIYFMLRQMFRFPVSYFKAYWINSWSKSTVVLLFMQTIDSTLHFKRGLFGGMRSSVGRGKAPSSDIPESEELTKGFSNIVNGKPTTFSLESLAGIPSTAHILGGAVMGRNEKEGVIDKNNKIFGYENLYVIDGSMISANPGVNPSLTITAIAERAMDMIGDV